MVLSKTRVLIAITIAAFFSLALSAKPPAGPVGVISKGSPALVATPLDTSGGGSTCGTCQCFPWKIGDRDQAGTTWVASSDSYLYSGAEHFHPANTAPGDLSSGPDLAGIIGVGFANPNFIPRRVDIYYSFFPVNRAWHGGDENGPDPGPVSTPAPARFGLTWFNGYEAGSTQPPNEATIVTYPSAGVITYGPFSVSPFNINTRYNVYVKTGKFGNNGKANGNPGAGANENSFALAGVICFSR